MALALADGVSVWRCTGSLASGVCILALPLAGRIWRFEHLALGVGPLDENVTIGKVLNLQWPRRGQ